MKIKERINKRKEWVKENKDTILGLGLLAGCTVLSYALGAKAQKAKDDELTLELPGMSKYGRSMFDMIDDMAYRGSNYIGFTNINENNNQIKLTQLGKLTDDMKDLFDDCIIPDTEITGLVAFYKKED